MTQPAAAPYHPERSGKDRREQPHDCPQVGPITALEVTTQNIEKTLSEQSETLKRLVTIFEQISSQNQQIINMQASIQRHEKSIGELYGRVTHLEIKGEGTKVRLWFIVTGMTAASSLAAMLLGKLLASWGLK